MGRGPLLTVCPRPLTLASSLRMGPRGQKVLLRYACKKELDMHVYSQGAAADGEVAADDARAGSVGGGARARPSCSLSTSQSICARESLCCAGDGRAVLRATRGAAADGEVAADDARTGSGRRCSSTAVLHSDLKPVDDKRESWCWWRCGALSRRAFVLTFERCWNTLF